MAASPPPRAAKIFRPPVAINPGRAFKEGPPGRDLSRTQTDASCGTPNPAQVKAGENRDFTKRLQTWRFGSLPLKNPQFQTEPQKRCRSQGRPACLQLLTAATVQKEFLPGGDRHPAAA